MTSSGPRIEGGELFGFFLLQVVLSDKTPRDVHRRSMLQGTRCMVPAVGLLETNCLGTPYPSLFIAEQALPLGPHK